jgi:transposase
LAIRQRTALCNQTRGLLAEYGICLPRGVSTIRKNIPMLLADDDDDLSGVFKMTLTQQAQQLASLDAGIALFDKAIIQASKNNDVCKRQQSIPGIGPMVSLEERSSSKNCEGKQLMNKQVKPAY